MASSTDSAFVEDTDVHRNLRSRPNASRSNSQMPLRDERPDKSGASSPAFNMDNEAAPLLNDNEDGRRSSDTDYGSVNGRGDGDEEPEWFGTAELRDIPWWKRPSIYWMLPIFFLTCLAFGGIIVPKLNLIMDLVCDEYYAQQDPDPISGPMDPGQQPDRCQNDAVSARSSLFLLYGNLCSGILSAITSPKLGALSDRYGRKKLLAMTTCGVLVGDLLTILAAKYPETVSVNWILVGYAIDGLCGSFIVGMALVHSYGADCTPPNKRNVAFGYFHASLFTGIAVGPVLAGYIIDARAKYVGKTEAVLLVFYIATAMHLIFITFLFIAVPESLSKSRQEAAREKHRQEVERLGPAADWINQIRALNFFEPLKILWPTGPGSSSAVRWNLLLLAATDTIMFGVGMGAMGVVVVYVRRQFGWQDLESGRFVSIVNASRVVALVVALPLLTLLFKGKQTNKKQRNSGSDRFDLGVIRLAVLFDMLGFLGYSLAQTGTVFTLSGAVTAIGGVGSPTLGSALTKHVPPDQVGQLLGALGLLHAVARVVGPTIFNGIYSATVSHFRQTVFVCLTATFGAAFACSWFVKPHVYLEGLEPDGSPSRRDEEDVVR